MAQELRKATVRLSVIIVTFNSAHVVADAIRGLHPADVEMIVVDNGSHDETVAVVGAENPKARIIQNGANLGFARAVNIGVTAAHGSILLLLNPDAVITADSIDGMTRFLSNNSECAIASPLVIEGDGHLATLAGGFEPTIWRMLTHATGLSRFSGRRPALRGHYLLRDHLTPNSPMALDWVSGGCMFVRSDVWASLGGLSERWFMYAEDVDFCLRASDAGMQVVLIPWHKAYHVVGASSSSLPAIKTVWLENLFDLYAMRCSAGWVRKWTWKLVVASGYWGRAAVYGLQALRGRSNAKVNAMRFEAYARTVLRARARP